MTITLIILNFTF